VVVVVQSFAAMHALHPVPLSVLLVGLMAVAVLAAVDDSDGWSDDPEHLNVFIVPHSHNDPGWWYTFEHYYEQWTKSIITSVTEALAMVHYCHILLLRHYSLC
jgi:hypothetical protein